MIDTRKESDKEESVILSIIPPLEKVKDEKGLKILTPNKLLTRLTILLVQIQVGNTSVKLKKWKQANAISFVSLQ